MSVLCFSKSGRWFGVTVVSLSASNMQPAQAVQEGQRQHRCKNSFGCVFAVHPDAGGDGGVRKAASQREDRPRPREAVLLKIQHCETASTWTSLFFLGVWLQDVCCTSVKAHYSCSQSCFLLLFLLPARKPVLGGGGGKGAGGKGAVAAAEGTEE